MFTVYGAYRWPQSGSPTTNYSITGIKFDRYATGRSFSDHFPQILAYATYYRNRGFLGFSSTFESRRHVRWCILGLVLIFWCIFSYITPKFKLPAPKERPAGIISGLATGIINGLTGSQVVPCVPYLMALDLDRSVFIQETNISFTLSSLIMAIGLTRLELFTLDAIKISIAGLVLVYFGLKLGSKVRPFLSPDNFRLAVLVVLFITALGLLLKAF